MNLTAGYCLAAAVVASAEAQGLRYVQRRANLADIAEDARDRPGPQLVVELDVASIHGEPVDPHRWEWLVRLVRILRQREVAEVQCAIGPQHGAQQGRLDRDLAEGEGPVPQRSDLEIHEQPLEAEHRLTVGVGQGEVAHLGLQLERVDGDRADGEFALIVLAHECLRLVAHDGRRDLETEQRIETNECHRDRGGPEQFRLKDVRHVAPGRPLTATTGPQPAPRDQRRRQRARSSHFSSPSQR